MFLYLFVGIFTNLNFNEAKSASNMPPLWGHPVCLNKTPEKEMEQADGDWDATFGWGGPEHEAGRNRGTGGTTKDARKDR